MVYLFFLVDFAFERIPKLGKRVVFGELENDQLENNNDEVQVDKHFPLVVGWSAVLCRPSRNTYYTIRLKRRRWIHF